MVQPPLSWCSAGAPVCIISPTNSWVPPLLLLCHQFACVAGFVLTWIFCVKNIIISKCSYCQHNLNIVLVKQETIILWSEVRKSLHCWVLKGHIIQRWKQPSYIQPFLSTGGSILGKMDLGSEVLRLSFWDWFCLVSYNHPEKGSWIGPSSRESLRIIKTVRQQWGNTKIRTIKVPWVYRVKHTSSFMRFNTCK